MSTKKIRTKHPTECWACGTFGPCESHHIRPKQYGGTEDDGNIVPLCGDCHEFVSYRFRTEIDAFSWIMQKLNESDPPTWLKLYGLILCQYAGAIKFHNCPRHMQDQMQRR